MINPNKNYKVKELGRIVEIGPDYNNNAEVTVKTDSGKLLKGFLNDLHAYPKSLTVGQRVGYTVRYSIVLDQWRLASLVKKRGVK